MILGSEKAISVAKARSIFRELAWILGNRFIMSIVGHGDESYNSIESGGYIIAGWFAHKDDWENFCGHWQNALIECKAPYLHMRELGDDARAKPDNPFHGWDDQRVDEFVRHMIPVVTGHAIFGLSCAIDAARPETLPEAIRLRYRSPYVLAFQFFFEEVIEILNGRTEFRHNIPSNEKVSLVFDHVDRAVNIEAHYAFNNLKNCKADGDRFGTLAFADSRPEGLLADCHFLPLQAADLVANRSFKTYKRELDRKNTTVDFESWDAALKERRNLISTHLGQKEIEDFAQRIIKREADEHPTNPA